MLPKFNLALAPLGFAALSLTACASSNGLEEENVATVQQAHAAWNGLTANGLTVNGLTVNGLTSVGFPSDSLTSNALSENSAFITEMTNSQYSRDLFSYIVSCALPSTAAPIQLTLSTPNPTLYSYPGDLGLAPAWANGPCDAACKSWVSGCILARLNATGANVHLSLRGTGIPMNEGELENYLLPEATYYGDLFSTAPMHYACTINGSTLIERVCGAGSAALSPPYAGCVINVLDDCAAGLPPRCEGPDLVDGHFSNCTDPQSATYNGSITVYRQLN